MNFKDILYEVRLTLVPELLRTHLQSLRTTLKALRTGPLQGLGAPTFLGQSAEAYASRG